MKAVTINAWTFVDEQEEVANHKETGHPCMYLDLKRAKAAARHWPGCRIKNVRVTIESVTRKVSK